jgi:hypothetical protein
MKKTSRTWNVARGILCCALSLVATACGDASEVDGERESGITGEADAWAAETPGPALAPAARKLDTRPEGPPHEYVKTPVGRFHRSCVSEVPDGAEIDARGNVSLRGATVGRSDRCKYKSFRSQRGLETDQQLPTVEGWVSRIYATAPHPPSGHRWYNGMTSTVTVPGNPLNRNGQLVYLFTSFLPFSNNMIIQPVLQWGIGPAGGGTKWTAAAWYVDDDDLVRHSPLRDITAGDVMTGQMAALPGTCDGWGVCRWAAAWARNGAGLTSMVVQGTEPFTIADKAVLEADGVDSCRQWPSGGAVVFRNVYLTQPWLSLEDRTDVTARVRWTSKIWAVTPNSNYGTVVPNPNVGVLTFSYQ